MDDDAPGRRTLSWVTREGVRTQLPFEPDDYAYPRLSPDGRRLAIEIARDIWVIDLVPGRSDFDRLQRGQFVCRQEQPDRPGLSRDSTDQAPPLERDDHVVDRRRRNLKEPLEVRFGRGLSVQ